MDRLTSLAVFLCPVFLAVPAGADTGHGPVQGPDGMIRPRALRPNGLRPPWQPRHRIGVKVMPDWAQQLRPRDLETLGLTRQEMRDLGLSLRQLRALGIRPRGQGLIDQSRWPEEPPRPGTVETRRLAKAMRQLCPVLVPKKRLSRYARWIVRYSARFGVDPTLLAALIYQQSRCSARAKSSWGLGLAMINHQMHRPWIDPHDGSYRFWVLASGAWRTRRLAMNRFAFTPENLLRAEPSIYFAAGILKVLRRQCPAMDRGFRSVPHRHAVSHFIWGDRVRGAGPEDRVLRARRRLIGYYNARPVAALGRFKDLPLSCPLDGAPRKTTSGLGDDREGGKRRHTGVDIDSEQGEPVRAVADGKVVLAGVDRGGNRLRPLDPKLTRLVPAARMGPRGLLVVIEHARQLTSHYMHLSAYVVRTGQRVKGGQLLGYVGRTGIQESEAHLHFGLQHKKRHIDPLVHLRPYLFSPEATYVGRNYQTYQRQRRKLRDPR